MNKNITFQKTYSLSTDLVQSCFHLSDICNETDHLSNPCFVDEDYDADCGLPCLYYALDNSDIIGFLSVYIIDSYNAEICIFVLPKYRKNQVGSELFARMVADYNSYSFQLSMVPKNEIGKQFISKMGFEYCSTECSMELIRDNYFPVKNTVSLTPVKHANEIIITGMISKQEIGQCIISVFDDFVCIHDVEIWEKYRGKGYGYRLITTVLNHIFEKYNNVVLHVTKDNIPAYHLYTKVGFHILQELDYYAL